MEAQTMMTGATSIPMVQREGAHIRYVEKRLISCMEQKQLIICMLRWVCLCRVLLSTPFETERFSILIPVPLLIAGELFQTMA